jgi:hypothetical protein
VDKQDQAPPADEPEAPAGEVSHRCTLCRAGIATELYLLRGLVLCPACAQSIERRQSGPAKVRRALLFGTVLAAAAALTWSVATAAVHRPLSGFAVVAGIVIGLAVRQGSRGRGGWRYQVTAVLLTYAAFVARYVPPVFGGIADAIKKEHAAEVALWPTAGGSEARREAGMGTAAVTTTATAPESPRGAPATSMMATVKAYFVFTLVGWGLVLAAPFMPGTMGLWPLLCLAAGMAIASRLNRRVLVQGPFASPG